MTTATAPEALAEVIVVAAPALTKATSTEQASTEQASTEQASTEQASAVDATANALDIATLYQVSMLVDALRDTARTMTVSEREIAEHALTSMRLRFNKLRATYADLLAADESSHGWIPAKLEDPTSVEEIFDAAAALASLIDTTMHTPAVLLNHKMAANKIAQIEGMLSSVPAYPAGAPAAPAEPTETFGRGQYL